MRRYFLNLIFAIFARYEGGQMGYGSGRSYLPAMVQDARFDADQPSRLEILRKARYWERNNAIVNRLADTFEMYTVGAGVPMTPASDDEKWNVNAALYWQQSGKLLDLCSLQGFSVIQSLIARTFFIDGEVFILKTRGDSKFPRIKLIESHRVGTPGSHPETNGRQIFDGVEVDNNGRPIAYWVQNDLDGQTYERIEAGRIIHIFEPSRVGQYRGLSFLYAVLNDIHDLDDLQILEQKAAREAAEITNVLTNSAGEFSSDGLRKMRFETTTQNASGEDVLQTRADYVKRATGARSIALKTGEKFEQFRSERPSVATQGYWDFLTSKICAGVGITKQLVFPWSIQGTVVRADLDIAANFFKNRHAVLAAAFTEIYLFVMAYGIQQEPTIAGVPWNWRSVNVRAPRAVNVDVGRNSRAMLEELAAGTTTLEKIYGELGLDWREQVRQRAREIRFIEDTASEVGIDPHKLSNLMLEKAQEQPQQQPVSA